MTSPDRPNRRQPVIVEDSPEDTKPTPRRAPASMGFDEDGPSPADAPPIGDIDTPRMPTRLESAIRFASRPLSGPTRLLLGSGLTLVSFLATLVAFRFIEDMLTRWPFLGWVAVGLVALFVLAAILVALREGLAWRRLMRLDAIQGDARAALASGKLADAQTVAAQITRLYAARPELTWGQKRIEELTADAYDGTDLLHLVEAELLAKIDLAARQEVESSARNVAMVTALIPLTLIDILAAMAANLRMIRRIAELYGGRAGMFGSWRLLRAVLAHLVATGIVAAGDDLVHTVIGGGALAKLSRRFGEGVINGALTARVGVAAIEVCRPLPFMTQPRPRVAELLRRGLQGLFGRDS